MVGPREGFNPMSQGEQNGGEEEKKKQMQKIFENPDIASEIAKQIEETENPEE
jgi:hypothetical protein